MARRRLLGLVAVGNIATMGCASTWDTMTSNEFKEAPFKRMFKSQDDPMITLRNKASGTERANAMRRLKEPARHGGSAAEQDEAIQMLSQAACGDSSPVVRISAIDALGRFRDPRAAKLLMTAYSQADGAKPLSINEIQQAGNVEIAKLISPNGFPPEFSTTIRVRTIAAIAETGDIEGVTFLRSIAMKDPEKDNVSNDIRVAAVRGLKQIRHPASVKALAEILNAEYARDVVITNNAHEGLVSLTGRKLPPDPKQWNEVVQAGAEVVQEPSGIQRALHLR